MKVRIVMACLVAWALSPVMVLADTISSLSPQSFYAGSAEEYVSINGSGLAGTDPTLATTVVFSGPAGSFSIDANTTADTLLEVFVPIRVFGAVGTYTVTAFAHDVGGTTRQIGPASLSIVSRPASTVPLLTLPEVVIAEAASPSGAVVTFAAGGTNPDGSTTAVSCDHARAPCSRSTRRSCNARPDRRLVRFSWS